MMMLMILLLLLMMMMMMMISICNFLLLTCRSLVLFATICSCLLLFDAISCYLQLFAAKNVPVRCPDDHLSCDLLLYAPKSVPVGSQNDHLRSQTDSKIDQQSTKIGSWGSPGTPRAQLSPNFDSQGPFWSPFWEPRRSQIRPKIAVGTQNIDMEAHFPSCFMPLLF